MKTYTQKQMDRAKHVAYRKGYNEGKEEMTIDQAWENAEQVTSWNDNESWEWKDFNWTVVFITVLCSMIVLSMVLSNTKF